MPRKAKAKPTYKDTMLSLENDITGFISKYIEDNKIIYSCHSQEFISGLTLGLKAGTELLFSKLTKVDVPYSTENSIKLYKNIQNMKNE